MLYLGLELQLKLEMMGYLITFHIIIDTRA